MKEKHKLPLSCSQCKYFNNDYQLEPYCEISNVTPPRYSYDKPPKLCPMRNKILAPDVKEKMKIIDMKSEFIKIYGTRPNKRSIQSLIEDIQKQEQELKKMKETLEACQNYDSLWASYPKN